MMWDLNHLNQDFLVLFVIPNPSQLHIKPENNAALQSFTTLLWPVDWARSKHMCKTEIEICNRQDVLGLIKYLIQAPLILLSCMYYKG